MTPPDKQAVRQQLQQLHDDISIAEAEHEDEHSGFEALRESIAGFLSRADHELDEVQEEFSLRLTEIGNTLEARFPGIGATVRAALDIINNAGV